MAKLLARQARTRHVTPLVGLFESFGDGFTSHESPHLPQTSSTSRLQVLKDSRHISQALTLLETWRLRKLDPLLYRALMRLCAEAKALSQAQRLHAHIETAGCADHRFLLNELVYTYGRCEGVDQARTTFQSIKDPDTWSYNCLLAAYALNGHLHPALELFEKIPEKNIVSWNTMLKAFINHGFYEDARDFFMEIPDKNAVSWNIMLTAYSQNGFVDHALAMIELMPESNVVSWNVIISGYARLGELTRAVLAFRCMLLQGFFPINGTFLPLLQSLRDLEVCREIHGLVMESRFGDDLLVMNAVLGMYAGCKSLEDCVTTLSCMEMKDVVSWSFMITAYSQSGDLESARDIFESMSFRDERALSAMTVALAENGRVEEARSLLEEMTEKTKESFVALISAYGKAGDVVAAEALFESMPERDSEAWNSMVAAYAENKCFRRSVQSLGAMEIEGILPNQATLVSVFRACSTSSEGFLHGKTLHRQLAEEEAVKRCGDVQAEVLGMYLKQGSFADSCLVFSQMSVRNCAAWTMIIAAHVERGFVNKAFLLFYGMNQEGVLPDASTLQALSKINDFG